MTDFKKGDFVLIPGRTSTKDEARISYSYEDKGKPFFWVSCWSGARGVAQEHIILIRRKRWYEFWL